MNRILCALIVLPALVAAGAANAQDVDIQWSDKGHFENHIAIQHGKLVEACAKLVPGDKVKWEFESRAVVDFNIHYHVGHDVKFPAKQDATQKADGLLEVTSAQDYCWMWSTKTASGMDVEFKLDKSR